MSLVPEGLVVEAVLRCTILEEWSTFLVKVVEVVSPEAPMISLNSVISGFGFRVEI